MTNKTSDHFTQLLQKLNALEIAIIVYFAWFLTRMWDWFAIHHAELKLESAGVFSSLVLLIAGSLKMALTNIMKRWNKND